MKKTVTLLILIFITVPGMAQNNMVEPENIQTGEVTTCGDGVCNPTEQGVCPQDCKPKENNSTPKKTEKTEKPRKIIFYGSLALSGLFLITAICVHLKNKDSNQESGLSQWITERKNEGYSDTEIEKFLIEEGYSKKEIKEAKN